MTVSERLLSILVCPEDRGALLLTRDDGDRPAEVLYNPRLRKVYRVEDGIPVLLVDDSVTIADEAHHQGLVERAQV